MNWQLIVIVACGAAGAWLLCRGDRLNRTTERVLWVFELGLARRRQPPAPVESAYPEPEPEPEWLLRYRRMNQRFETAKRAKSY